MNKPGEPKTKYTPFGSNGPPSESPVQTGDKQPWFGPQDLYLFNEGSHLKLYDKFGAHPSTSGGVPGFHFAVWAPNADYVSIVGDFNDWDRGRNPMHPVGSSGVWAGFIAGVKSGSCYKYHVAAPGGFTAEKTDPFAFTCEIPPKTASVTWDLDYIWSDAEWMATRKAKAAQTRRSASTRSISAPGCGRPTRPITR